MSSPSSQLENTAPVLPLSIPNPVSADPSSPPVAASFHVAWPDRGHAFGPAPDTCSDMAADADTCAGRGPAAAHVQAGLPLLGSEVPSGSASAPTPVSLLSRVQAPALAAQTAPASPSGAQDLLITPDQAQLLLPPSPADQNKKARGPVLQRSSGPSLLTQALASARGILSTSSPGGAGHPDPTRTSSPQAQGSQSPSSNHTHTSTVKQVNGSSALPTPIASHKDVRGDPPPQGDDTSSLTASQARFVSHSPAMPASTVVSTITVSVSSHSSPINKLYPTLSHNGVEFGGVDPRTWVHHGLRPQNTNRGSSLDELDRRPPQSPVTPSSAAPGVEKTTPASTNTPTRAPNQQRTAQGEDPSGAPESRGSQRPRNVEHRVSMGPEKIWSIGSGERDSLRDGQVEKSVTEVLSGIEHNNRSRKASHSLRFFKEGLPEEKTKKKEPSRHGGHGRDTSPQLESIPQADHVDLDEGDKQSGVHQSPRDLRTGLADPGQATRSPVLADAGRTRLDSDYFVHAQAVDKTPTLEDFATRRHDGGKTEDYKLLPEPAIGTKEQGHERRNSGDSTATAGSGEYGDDSSEEKISSAVFVPHQAPQEPSGAVPTAPVSLQRQPPGQRAAPRGDDWLVKADEPEADQHEEEEQSPTRPGQSRDMSALRSEASGIEFAQLKRATDELIAPNVDPRNHVQAPAPPQYSDGPAVEEQPPPEPTLEAIELIPYKHQVGGHTTLWRFSKRAVCKQLNNRENEFYERIEHDVGDLLAFLPRYIGVLNVTFHKQPRRKSTLKREDAAALERKLIDQAASNGALGSNGGAAQHEIQTKAPESAKAMPAHHRVISQSLQSSQIPVPTVTFVDNQHILPRHLLQPSPKPVIHSQGSRFRSSSVVTLSGDGQDGCKRRLTHRPTLEDRHANSWGATTVNKRLRNEVFNDVFLKHPVPMRPHRRSRGTFPRSSLPNFLRPSTSDAHIPVPKSTPIERADSDPDHPTIGGRDLIENQRFSRRPKGHSIDAGLSPCGAANDGQESPEAEKKEDCIPQDITGTSAPEPEIFGEKVPGKRRRYSSSGLRRRTDQDLESRGTLQYFQEPDDAHFKPDSRPEADVDALQPVRENGNHQASADAADGGAVSDYPSTVTSGAASPTAELKRIPRPINPKEAQTQRDSRVEYFLLLEDLTAGMKRPCIMDLKMGTRQYGVDANPKKQKSQHRKCAGTTSRELGVRVCGLQVWDAKSQTYIFRDKYYGRDLKAGSEFQGALERFLYDGVDRASILRHIPTVLEKLRQLEVIIRRLDGYRFYAASLLMFYDGDAGQDGVDDNDATTIEDSTTDFATDTEDIYPNGSAAAARKKRRNKREIDFKMADFANSVTPAALGDASSMAEKPCPPQHPGEPDRGFLRGLRSLRRYFLKIQRETREELGLGLASAAAAAAAGHRNGGGTGGDDASAGAVGDYADPTEDEYSGDEGCVSE
ncbi:hypothetical protein RB595_004442 [Gaeumannomyces hyphopodioides]